MSVVLILVLVPFVISDSRSFRHLIYSCCDTFNFCIFILAFIASQFSLLSIIVPGWQHCHPSWQHCQSSKKQRLTGLCINGASNKTNEISRNLKRRKLRQKDEEMMRWTEESDLIRIERLENESLENESIKKKSKIHMANGIWLDYYTEKSCRGNRVKFNRFCFSNG